MTAVDASGIEELATEYGPGICGYVIDNAHPLLAYGAGTGKLGTRSPLQMDQEFRLASMTKMYVATVVLRLVESGACQLQDSLETWLPGAVPDAAAVTIEHPLSMRSGIPDYLSELLGDPPDVARYDAYFTPTQLVQLAVACGKRHDPGTQFEYSSTNYILLGLIIERVTGKPVDAILRQYIFGPLKLRRTTFQPVDPFLRGPHGHGYVRLSESAGFVDVTVQQQSAVWTAGAIISTPEEVAAFLDGLMTGRIISSWDRMRELTPISPEFGYGMGLQGYRLPTGEMAYGHCGNAPGFQSIGLRTPSGRAVVLYRNASDLVHPLPEPMNLPFIVEALSSELAASAS